MKPNISTYDLKKKFSNSVKLSGVDVYKPRILFHPPNN